MPRHRNGKPEAGLTSLQRPCLPRDARQVRGYRGRQPEEAAVQARDLPPNWQGSSTIAKARISRRSIGDEDYAQSRIIDFDGERHRKVAAVMRLALGRLVTAAENLAAAIDGAADQFAEETAQIGVRPSRQEDAMAGTRYPRTRRFLARARAPARQTCQSRRHSRPERAWRLSSGRSADVKELRPDLTDEQASTC